MEDKTQTNRNKLNKPCLSTRKIAEEQSAFLFQMLQIKKFLQNMLHSFQLVSKDGYTLPGDQSMPGLQVLLEVFELIFGCLFGVEVVLRLWGIGWSSLEFKLKLFWVTQIE